MGTGNGSARFTLDGTDWRKIAKGALIAATGGVLGYAATVIVPQLEEHGTQLAVLGAVLINAVWKWFKENNPPPA
jgi:hypothetical protein